MDLAVLLSTPLTEVKARTTSREFFRWILWMDKQWHKITRLDYQLAKIAYEVVRGRASRPNQVKLDSMIVRFDETKKKEPTTLTEEDKETRAKRSKSIWLGFANLGKRK